MQDKKNKRIAVILTILVAMLLIPFGSYAADYGDADTIKYATNIEKAVFFDEDDFFNAGQSLTGEDLDYIKFTLPDSEDGTLYYDYDDGDYDYEVSSSKRYYYDASPYLSKVAFLPGEDFEGTVTIRYTGYDEDGNTFSGKVRVTVSGSEEDLPAAKITYKIDGDETISFDEEDFYDLSDELNGEPLDYVTFTLPSSTTGFLYYDYDDGDYDSRVSASEKYYYGDSPYLSKVTFVPAGGSPGVNKISFKGYDTEDNSFSGTVEITVGDSDAPANTALKKSKYFDDVDEAYSWAVDYIDILYQRGIITGSIGEDGLKHYDPAAKIKRGEFMLLLYRALNIPSSTASGNFSDVAKGEYYYEAVAAAKALGIAQGSDNKFYPNASITREDTMVLALRALNKTGYGLAAGNVSTLSAYSDQNVISSYAREPIAALIKARVITGSDDNKIHPMESITRAEAAAIIYRIKY